MPQKQEAIKPIFLNLDSAVDNLQASEALFLKSVSFDINANPNPALGTNNSTGEGQNLFDSTTLRSNLAVANFPLPNTGYNKHIGSFESRPTQELFCCIYNSLARHTIVVVDGNTGVATKVIEDPELQFSDNPEAFIANHRCSIRLLKDKSGNIIERYLLITDGQSWQKYISVTAAIKTNGFDIGLFPYWVLQPPHFDRRELLEWAIRPPMIKPIVSTIPNTSADSGKINQIIDKAFQVAIVFQNTDGRTSQPGPYSLPLIVRSTDFLNTPDIIPKNAKFVFPAGSPLTERMLIYIRQAELDRASQGTQTPEWSSWELYDTIDKFTSSGVNSPAAIGNDYWLRQNQWASYNYNTVFNTIDYIFDNSKNGQITNQEEFKKLESGLPQLSYAMTDAGDAVLLANNRYGYPNFSGDVMDNLDVEVVEKPQDGCVLPLRDMYFYAYVGRPSDLFNYTSQVGYTHGDDKTVRFGGLNIKTSPEITFTPGDSVDLGLDFADKQAFQLYLKGTPYSAVGEWYRVNSDNTLFKLDAIFNFGDQAQVSAAGNMFVNGGYFICRFKITAPAGRYIATIGRHNVKITEDYRNTSTYIYGIANSRVKTVDNGIPYIRPNAITQYSKELEVDCTNGNVDVWGNGNDLFYIYCPFVTGENNRKYRFIEGYLRESVDTPLPVELFPYNMNHSATDDWGHITDKNGFYFAYTKIRTADQVDIEVRAKIDCQYPVLFTIPTSESGSGWKRNSPAYLTGHASINGCNRIVYTGKITDLTGTLNYSNIAVSLKDGSTAYTKQDGTFTIIAHNGQNTTRNSNVYVNAGGNFIITVANCGQVPLFNFDENLVPCVNCNVRTYPIPLNLGVKIDSTNQTSLKEGSKYTIGIYGMDLAGRVMYVNEIKDIVVPSFLLRNNFNATYFRMLIAGALNLSNFPDIKWIVPCVTKNLSQKRYLDWVGDNINYIDNNGNIVTDVSTAVFCSINITSLYNYNVSNNFSVLANYQFTPKDRLRILDDGDGNLYDIATYGEPIDLEIYGTNFNQAAINAGLLPPTTNTVFNTTAAQTTQDQSVTLIVRYNAKLDKLLKKVGFWIQTYSPTKSNELIPFMEIGGAYPIISGEIAEYIGGGYTNPQYTYPVSIDIEFWDTYFLSRIITIPNVGSKLFSHIFQSANITDTWGELITSGGRINIKNKNAKQMWFGADTIKSDDFVKEGLVNGLCTFRPENRKSFSTYPFGDIVAMKSERNIIGIYCENDYFMVDYNYHYTYANEQGVMITNLDNGLSTPHQKVKGKYGISKEDTGTFIVSEEGVFWLDRKNTAFIKMDYRQAVDISQLTEEYGEKGGIQSYLNSKVQFVNDWNATHDTKDRFDAICGIDAERGNVYLTFRPRRDNTNRISSYVNQRRDVDLRCQETVAYSIQYHSWTMFTGFTPEGYNMLRGKNANVEFISFAAGVPYYHSNTPNNSFLKFYGIQTEPAIKGVFGNTSKDAVKFFQSLAHNSNPNGWFVDMIYTNYINSFSYLSTNQFKKKENQFYAPILRNMNSFPNNAPVDLFRSMLFDGARMYGRYIVFRMVGKFDTLNDYNQLNSIYILEANSGNNKK